MVRVDVWCLRVESDPLKQKLQPPASPVKNLSYALPTELVALVFLHCLPERQELSPLTAPLLLTRICGDWRDIALRTPELWSSVFFELFAVPKGRLGSKMRMLDYWLERGAAHPLTLYLHYRQPLAGAVPLLAAHAARWADVDLFLHPTTLAAFSSAGQEGLQLPVLRRLSLGCLQQPDAPITAFQNAPALSDVALRRLAPSCIALPWAQLTRFYCQSDDPADVMRVLALAPGLQHLTLDLLPAAQPAPAPDLAPCQCVHAALQSLAVHTHPAAPLPVRALLAPLTLPALRTLELPPLGPADAGPLRAFVDRSRCAVTHLAAPLAPLAAGALPPALRALPALEALHLEYPAEAPLRDLLSALRGDEAEAEAEDGAPFLPRLRAVRLDRCRAAVPYPLLLAALHARWAPAADSGVARLRAFEMTVLAPETIADPACLGGLQALKTQGMRISVAHVCQPSVV